MSRYVVSKVAAGRFVIERGNSVIGWTRIGAVKSRKEAMQIARLLAGWKGKVDTK